jgi:hypothetical protein
MAGTGCPLAGSASIRKIERKRAFCTTLDVRNGTTGNGRDAELDKGGCVAGAETFAGLEPWGTLTESAPNAGTSERLKSNGVNIIFS